MSGSHRRIPPRLAPRRTPGTTGDERLTLVMGDVDLVRTLTLAGLRCALFTLPRAPARLSRGVVERLPWRDHWREPAGVAEMIASWAAGLPGRPVLMPQTDGDLLVLSRHRDLLARHCDLLLAEPDPVEALVDKERFSALAARLDLGIPRARRVDTAREDPDDLGLAFPVVLKPLLRDSERWSPLGAAAKARHVGNARALRELWPQLQALDVPVLAQEAIDGPESAIESFHAYVDRDGAFVGGFTGRKIRTWPLQYGHSTALEITDEADVAARGREVLERLELRGVAKVDFKRDPQGRLHLLEVNPRFTLWHHPAAVAGLNIPALVHADLTGRPRPAFGAARAGVRWCLPHLDLRAARADGVGLRAWLGFLARCEARSGLALDDPFPTVPGVAWHRVARRLAGA